MIFRKTLKYYAKDLFVQDGYWDRKRKQKGLGIIEKVLYKKRLLVKNHIIPMWGDFLPEKISIKTVDRKLCDLPFSGSTKNAIISCLKDIYTHLIEEEIIKENPIQNIIRFSVAPIKKRGALSPEEIEKLFPENYEELLKIWGSEMYACAFLILKDTGLRPGELRALQWKDWYLDEKSFPIMKAIEAGTRNKIKGTKTGLVRPTVVTEFTANYIEYFRKLKIRKPDDFIFVERYGLPPRNSVMSRHFREGVERAGLNRAEISPYWLRHTFNTRMLETLSDDMVQKLMGHKTYEMTQRYRDADIKSLLREAKEISKFLPKEKVKENVLQLEFNFCKN
jgi:integrase